MGLMASFERGMERFLVPVAIKLNSQKHVAAVRDGFVFTFPIIMASSLIILINFAILSPDGFIAGSYYSANTVKITMSTTFITINIFAVRIDKRVSHNNIVSKIHLALRD